MAEGDRLLALIVTPGASDAALALQFLGESGIEAQAYGTLTDLCTQLSNDAGCVVIVEEALTDAELPALRDFLGRQPPWSDLPLLLVGQEGAALGAAASRAFPNSGNLTLLAQPLNPTILVSAVQVALRARARQFEVRDLLAQREAALQLRDEFLAMLAHELRNPLTPMRNAVYLQKKLRLDDGAFVRTRDMLDRQITHLSRMVDDLLDVARLERGKVQLHVQRVELNALVAATAEGLSAAIRAQGHTLHVALASEPLFVDADPVRLEQLITNLIGNATKFTPKPGQIAITTTRDNDTAAISVRDNGIGIRPEMLDRIFDLFTQDDRTLARSAGGLGIGLTIAHRVARLHGGTLEAKSMGTNTGATFTARLPLAQGATSAAADIATADDTGRRRRILVVEDNADVRESLSMMLDIWGHSVVLAETGHKGLEVIGQDQIDVALIDIGLPGMSGYDLAQAIRATNAPWSSSIKLIAITGYGQPADRERARACGFDAHLLKPVDPGALQKMLAN